MSAARRLADAISTHTGAREFNRTLKAVVTSTNPLGAKVIGHAIELDDEDLSLGQWARSYDARVGIAQDDILIITPTGDDDFVVVEVLSENGP